MPVYQYQCRNKECQHEFEQALAVDVRHKGRCPKCGARGKKLFTPLQVGGFKERSVELWNKQTKEMEVVRVGSRDSLVRECSKRGLIHRGYSYHDKEE